MTSEKYKETTDAATTAKLVSLLHAQPKVKAPVDFMAQLQMRMASQAENTLASQDARLKSLLQSVPAVSAPPDFAFRVRARLAQTKAEETARNPLAWVESWFAKSFSFGQAASAMAAIALIAAFTTMQLRNGGTAPAIEADKTIARVESVSEAQLPVMPAAAAAAPVAVKAIPTVRHNVTLVKAPTVLAVKAENAVAKASSRTSIESAMYSAQAKQEVYLGRDHHAYGQQLAKVVAAKNAESMIAAF